jgi:hypothetical protein
MGYSSRYQMWKRQRRLCDEDFFERYFLLDAFLISCLLVGSWNTIFSSSILLNAALQQL